MRRLHTLVFAGCFVMSTASCAEAQSADLHPTLNKTPPREFLSKDLLELPQREQQAWLHGAMSQMVQTITVFDESTAKCIQDWYFEIGNGPEYIAKAITRYKDYPVSAVLIAAAEKACPAPKN